jgi:hypothetical protein
MLNSLLPALLATLPVLVTGLYLTQLAKRRLENRPVRQRVPVFVRDSKEK